MLLEIVIDTIILSGIVLGIMDAVRIPKKPHHYHVMKYGSKK